MRAAWLTFLAVLVTAAHAQTANVLPFHVQRSLLLVSVTLDGQPKTLIFDTGAERTLIQDSRNVEHQATLIVGTKTLNNFPVALVSLASMGLEAIHADGVLGQDVLNLYSRVLIDYRAHTLTLFQ